jgi:SAM-dependent methyltransferase
MAGVRQAVRLNISQDSWPLRVDLCPCDTDFVAWLKRRGIAGKAIFHFGTGAHHVVGLENAKLARPNQVLGVTASRQEYESYIDLVTADPRVAVIYKAMFLDIYTLDARSLPEFDVVTLFHLCEFYDPIHSRYAPLDDRRLLDLFLRKLRPRGRICFYLGSNGRDAMLRLVDSFIASGRLAIDERVGGLLICARPKAKRAAAARARDRTVIRALINA